MATQASPSFLIVSRQDSLYFFRIVKEQPIRAKKPEPNSAGKAQLGYGLFDDTHGATRGARRADCRRRSADTGGAGRDRTDGLLLAKQALSQLSYSPADWWVWMDSNHRPPPYQDGALTN
jgi:hypothetical protein